MEPAIAPLFAKSIYLVASAGILCYLLLYRNENDARRQYLESRRAALRAAADANVYAAELAAVDAELAEVSLLVAAAPLRNEEWVLHQVPSTMLVLAIVGLILIYMQLFHPGEETGLLGTVPDGFSGTVAFVVGGVLLSACMPLYLWVGKAGSRMRRVRLLRRKYVLQWECRDSAVLKTCDELLAYLPRNPFLWEEKARYLAFMEKFPEARDAIRKSGDLAPKNPDYAFAEAAYCLSSGDLDGAEKAVARATTMGLISRDPRPEIFGAAVAMHMGNREKACAMIGTALKKDRGFSEELIRKEVCLRKLDASLEEGR